MKKILIASHGHLASGIKSSLQILTGMTDQITTIDAYVDEHDYVADIKQYVKEIDGKPAIIFTDLFGGSVNQKVMLEVMEHNNIFVVSGTNLPIVLSVLLDEQELTREHLQELIDLSQVQLVEVKPNDDISDDSFLS
ncbi:PTS sugar transporter subunit IIA [Companilactobacillus allii]|uniref:PTS fructose transporter subunit IIA n=1 Tax=Companilactobacillus allii TaxID=1847728 RepID=A0A1P8Q537_9LACO|nr:PTS sugar transporter subunit IIA [Companilactobacillus allii]APX72951.1 PTS fructose transporter subunit IIA [Companilactobacillus allii]USQ67742.1 PTS sugar transporter subunit IIA [Companilactobacillus allii]